MNLDIYIKNKEMEEILNKLSKYPVIKVNPRVAQSLSRHKKIRYLSEKNNIFIRKGIISIPSNVKIKNNGKIFTFDF